MKYILAPNSSADELTAGSLGNSRAKSRETRHKLSWFWDIFCPVLRKMSLWVDKHRPTSLSKLDYHKDLAQQLKKLVSTPLHVLF